MTRQNVLSGRETLTLFDSREKKEKNYVVSGRNKKAQDRFPAYHCPMVSFDTPWCLNT